MNKRYLYLFLFLIVAFLFVIVFAVIRFIPQRKLSQTIFLYRESRLPVTTNELSGYFNNSQVQLSALNQYRTAQKLISRENVKIFNYFTSISFQVNHILSVQERNELENFLLENTRVMNILSLPLSSFPAIPQNYNSFPVQFDFFDSMELTNVVGLDILYQANSTSVSHPLLIASFQKQLDMVQNNMNAPTYYSLIDNFGSVKISMNVLETMLSKVAFTNEELKEIQVILKNFEGKFLITNALVGQAYLFMHAPINEWAYPGEWTNRNDHELSWLKKVDNWVYNKEAHCRIKILLNLYDAIKAGQENFATEFNFIEQLNSNITSEQNQKNSTFNDTWIYYNSILRMILVSHNRLISRIRAAQIATDVLIFRNENGKLPEKLSDLVPEYLDSLPESLFQNAEYVILNKSNLGDDFPLTDGFVILDNGWQGNEIEHGLSHNPNYVFRTVYGAFIISL